MAAPRLLPFLLALFLLVAPLAAPAQGLIFSVQRIQHADLSARQLRLEVGGEAARLSIGHLAVAGRTFDKVRIDCPRIRLSGFAMDCPEARLQAAGTAPLPLSFRFDAARGSFELNLMPTAGERWHLAGQGASRVEVELAQARVERLAWWLPSLKAWQPKGPVSGRLLLTRGATGDKLAVALGLAGLSFGDASGNHAGEKVAGHIELDAAGADGVWDWRLLADWKAGELYVAPVYLDKGGLKLAASGRLDKDTLAVDKAEVSLAGVGSLAASLALDRAGWVPRRFRVEGHGLDLAGAGRLFLNPWLEQAGRPKMELAGRLDITAEGQGREFQRLDLALAGASLSGAGVSLRGLDASLPWRADGPTRGRFGIAGGSLGRLPMGAFRADIDMDGWRFRIPVVDVPLLDGGVALQTIEAQRRDGKWEGAVSAVIRPISMPGLTGALGLPRMEGMLTASIPAVHLAGDRVAMDGVLVIQVFDGYLASRGLSVSGLFGPAPVLRIDDTEVRHLDLGQLTRTFSFGDISGFLDGDIEGLEMANWQPQRFDASLRSSPGDYRKRISQRAVQNISSLGGAGAGAAIQRSFLSFFESFGYDRIGLSCRLRNGVCRMGGVADTAQGYVIVKGGGVPAINVLGYNRAVDWDELIARLKRVTESNARPVIQ